MFLRVKVGKGSSGSQSRRGTVMIPLWYLLLSESSENRQPACILSGSVINLEVVPMLKFA